MAHIMVIQRNSEGRPCGWGACKSDDATRAKREAREVAIRQWRSHCCYAGEERGRMTAHDLEAEDGQRDLGVEQWDGEVRR